MAKKQNVPPKKGTIEYEIREEIKKMNEGQGFVGFDIEGARVFSEELKNAQGEIKKLCEKYEELSEKQKQNGISAKKFNELEKDKIKLLQEYYVKKQKEEEIHKKVTKELEYQNKKRREGLTLEEKTQHALETHIKGYKQISKGIAEISKGGKEIFNTLKGLASPWGKVDQSAAEYTRQIGGSAAAMDRLRQSTIEFVKAQNIGIKYNTSMEELIKLQGSYNSSLGRSIALTNSQKESMAAMRKVAGEQTTIDLSTKLENFGVNVEQAGNMMGRMFSNASKSGIAFDKYTKNVTDNLSVAQNYTFANGLRGLESMAAKATAIKLDMGQAVAFANKVSTLEGAIDSGARLSVLGGSFAQFGNPLSMMYEGLNDMEGLQDRLVNMFGNMGKWNSQTGQIDVSAYNKQRIKAAAEASGLDYNAIMTMINAKGRSNQVAKQLNNGNIDADTRELIINTAQLDKNGKAFVTLNGERKDVNDITNADASQLKALAASDSDNIKTIASTLTGWNDAVEGSKKQIDAIKASWGEEFMPWIKQNMIALVSATGFIATAVAVKTGAELLKGAGTIFNGGYNTFGGLGKGFTRSPKLNPTSQDLPSKYISKRSGTEWTHKGGGIFENSKGKTMTAKQLHINPSSATANTGVRTGIKGMLSGKIGGASWGSAAMGGLTGGLAGAAVTALSEFSNEAHNTGHKWANVAASGAATAIGTAFAGPIGGMLAGYIANTVMKGVDNARNKLKAEKNLSDTIGHTDLSKAAINRVDAYIKTGNMNELTSRDIKLLKESGDFDAVIAKAKAHPHASGGWVSGSFGTNHGSRWVKGSGDGMSDSNIIAASHGEFVVDAANARKYGSLLESMRNNTLKVLPGRDILKSMSVSGNSNRTSFNDSDNRLKIDFGNGITVNGNIKVDFGGVPSNIDASQLITPELTNQIIKQIETQVGRGLNREITKGFRFS